MKKTKKEMNMKKHPLLGKEVIYKIEGKKFTAFVAAIDDEKGLTLHALDQVKAGDFCNDKGECFCVNLNSNNVCAYSVSTAKRYEIAKKMIEDGVLDVDKYDFNCGKKISLYYGMTACAFS